MPTINYDKCMFCSGCVAVCPTGALVIYETFIELDEKLCNNCLNCVTICPMGAMED